MPEPITPDAVSTTPPQSSSTVSELEPLQLQARTSAGRLLGLARPITHTSGGRGRWLWQVKAGRTTVTVSTRVEAALRLLQLVDSLARTGGASELAADDEPGDLGGGSGSRLSAGDIVWTVTAPHCVTCDEPIHAVGTPPDVTWHHHKDATAAHQARPRWRRTDHQQAVRALLPGPLDARHCVTCGQLIIYAADADGDYWVHANPPPHTHPAEPEPAPAAALINEVATILNHRGELADSALLDQLDRAHQRYVHTH